MPLLYYGDEYGEFGGGDPDNRHMLRAGTQLSGSEAKQLTRMRKLMSVRQTLRGLRRGSYVPALVSEDVLAFGRPDGDARQGALVVLNRLSVASTTQVPIPSEMGFAVGAELVDTLSGQTFVVPAAGGRLSVTVPARGGVVLSLK